MVYKTIDFYGFAGLSKTSRLELKKSKFEKKIKIDWLASETV
jgi:hypothetical protein